ncbi:hypothetical protein SDC9_59672 [bioreactor metagenome]|uniref:Uncharacterized protein n=1 Tax=bioreactor metagenome TaxID=1076179 RepID=A0A644XAQ8_9ZZZZ
MRYWFFYKYAKPACLSGKPLASASKTFDEITTIDCFIFTFGNTSIFKASHGFEPSGIQKTHLQTCQAHACKSLCE